MKYLFAAIALVAACSVASAAEVNKDTKAPVVASKAMTDADMDKVTAGVGIETNGANQFVFPNWSARGEDRGTGQGFIGQGSNAAKPCFASCAF